MVIEMLYLSCLSWTRSVGGCSPGLLDCRSNFPGAESPCFWLPFDLEFQFACWTASPKAENAFRGVSSESLEGTWWLGVRESGREVSWLEFCHATSCCAQHGGLAGCQWPVPTLSLEMRPPCSLTILIICPLPSVVLPGLLHGAKVWCSIVDSMGPGSLRSPYWTHLHLFPGKCRVTVCEQCLLGFPSCLLFSPLEP